MPIPIKFLLSLLVLIVGAIVFYFDSGNMQIGAHVRWVVAVLALLMVAAIWVFPEAGKEK